jgi:hypothetical protein
VEVRRSVAADSSAQPRKGLTHDVLLARDRTPRVPAPPPRGHAALPLELAARRAMLGRSKVAALDSSAGAVPPGPNIFAPRVVEMATPTGGLSPSRPVKERETMGSDGYQRYADAFLKGEAALRPAHSDRTLNPQVPGSSPGGPTTVCPLAFSAGGWPCSSLRTGRERRLSPSHPRLGHELDHRQLLSSARMASAVPASQVREQRAFASTDEPSRGLLVADASKTDAGTVTSSGRRQLRARPAPPKAGTFAACCQRARACR